MYENVLFSVVTQNAISEKTAPPTKKSEGNGPLTKKSEENVPSIKKSRQKIFYGPELPLKSLAMNGQTSTNAEGTYVCGPLIPHL